MKKVYLVLEKQPYYASFVHGVFTDYPKAVEFKKDLEIKEINIDEVWIHETEMNKSLREG